MKVVIKTEGGPGIGYGHIMRCLALSQAFQEAGDFVEMWIKGNPDLARIDSGVRIYLDDMGPASAFWKNIDGADVAIVDSYLDSEREYERIRQTARKAVYLDDNNRLPYPAGVVLNGAVGVNSQDYSFRDGTVGWLGADYILIRQEFWDAEPAPIREKIGTVLVTFGGEDPRRLTAPVMRLLTENHPDLKKRVIVGMGFTSKSELKGLADSNTELVESPSANGMVEAIRNSDAAVSAGGQTLNELARIGVPTVIVKAADNQNKTTAGWVESGFALLAGTWSEPDVMSSVDRVLRRMEDVRVRKNMAAAGLKISDGQGARRVVLSLKKLL